MAQTQEKLMINNVLVVQPDEEPGVNYETKYSENSGRLTSGYAVALPMFTVLQLSYSWSKLTGRELATILQNIVGRNFTLRFYNNYKGRWETQYFYVGKGSLVQKTLRDQEEFFSLSFNAECIEPDKVFDISNYGV